MKSSGGDVGPQPNSCIAPAVVWVEDEEREALFVVCSAEERGRRLNRERGGGWLKREREREGGLVATHIVRNGDGGKVRHGYCRDDDESEHEHERGHRACRVCVCGGGRRLLERRSMEESSPSKTVF